jgi:hypothetical protein
MNLRLLSCVGAVMLALSAQAGISYSASSGTIPDGSPVGWSATATLSDYLPSVSAVTVNLNLSGGYNGDLYAYLSYGGALVPLLNRVGVTDGNAFGYGTAGMNVTLAGDPGGYTDIHWVPSPTSGGTYAPDGRQIDPQSAPSAFDANGTIGFSAYNGMNPNGTWTLFIADLSGGAQSQLLGWSLDVTAEVPEPVNVALGVFGGIALIVTLARNHRIRNWAERRRVAIVHWINAV